MVNLFSPPIAEAANLAASQSSQTPEITMKSEDKQKRLELLTYVKAHFDLIAVTLLVGYLGYSLYILNKKQK
jgi:hypothetical protein